MKPKSVNNHLTVLRKALSVAIEWGYLDWLPPIRRAKEDKPEIVFLLPEELERLEDGCPKSWLPMVTVAGRTGLRLGELLALRWQDVELDGEAPRLRVQQSLAFGVVGTPKNHRTRSLPLHSKVVDAFATQRLQQRPDSTLVFPASEGGYMPRHRPYQALKSPRKRVGLAKRVGWHTLRHTFASNLVRKDVSLAVVQRLLGHASITMTMRYAHVADDLMVTAVNKLW